MSHLVAAHGLRVDERLVEEERRRALPAIGSTVRLGFEQRRVRRPSVRAPRTPRPAPVTGHLRQSAGSTGRRRRLPRSVGEILRPEMQVPVLAQADRRQGSAPSETAHAVDRDAEKLSRFPCSDQSFGSVAVAPIVRSIPRASRFHFGNTRADFRRHDALGSKAGRSGNCAGRHGLGRDA